MIKTEYRLWEMVDKINEHFIVGEPTKSRLSITGKPYVEFCNGFQIKEGESVAGTDKRDKFNLMEVLYDSILEYGRSVNGKTIYWREMPTLILFDRNFFKRMRVNFDSQIEAPDLVGLTDAEILEKYPEDLHYRITARLLIE